MGSRFWFLKRGVPLLVYRLADDGSEFAAGVITDVFTPDTNQSNTTDANGITYLPLTRLIGIRCSDNWNPREEGNGTISMPDLYSFLRPPYIFLIFGIISFPAAVFGTCTGKVSARFVWAYGAQEPVLFWLLVVTYYLVGVLFIGIFLFVSSRRDF
jgi:hypothetical protein